MLRTGIGITFCFAGFAVLAQGTFPPSSQSLDDSFANRAVISPIWSSTTNCISGSLSNATSEAGEPFIEGVSSGQTVWGTWTAPSNGILTFSFEAATFSPLLTVYAGSAPLNTGFPGSAETSSVFTNLSLVASNNYLVCYSDGQCGCHWREREQISFHATSGQAYQFCVDSAIITDAAMILQNTFFTNSDGTVVTGYFWGPTFTTNILNGGNFTLNLQFTPAPNNDDFANPIKLSGSRFSINVSNAGATKELGEPDHLGNSGGSSVWYTWTAPASGRVTLSTNKVPVYPPPDPSGGDGTGVIQITIGAGPPDCGNEVEQNPPPVFYPVFAAYTGTAVDALTPADCLPMSLDTFQNAVEFDAVKGQTYQIVFDGNLGTTGDIPLYIALTTPAPNNNFQHRIKLHGVSVNATGYNAGATPQAGEPVPVGSKGKTVWWSWTAPVSGVVSIDLSGSDYSFPAEVYTGSTVASLKMVAQGSGGLSFNAVKGKTYQIAVSDYNGLTGKINLNLLGPIVDLPLYRMFKSGRNATLTYIAAAGEVAALLYSADNVNWKIIQTTSVIGKTVTFQVRVPTPSGPFYRAILFDRIN